MATTPKKPSKRTKKIARRSPKPKNEGIEPDSEQRRLLGAKIVGAIPVEGSRAKVIDRTAEAVKNKTMFAVIGTQKPS